MEKAAASPPPRGDRRGRPWLLAIASLVLSLAAAEAFLRLFVAYPDPYARLKERSEVRSPGSAYVPSAYAPHHRITLRAEPGLPGMDTLPRTSTTNNLGFRGDSLAVPKPAGEYRVFMVGGSTTECVFLSDDEAVTAVLQRRLAETVGDGRRVRVYGAGKSGDRSWDHVAMVAHRIAHLQPDLVVVFAGVNDLAAGMQGKDYLMRPGVSPNSRLGGVDLLQMTATELHLPRLAHAALTGRGGAGRATSTSAYAAAAARYRALPLAPAPPRTDVAPYAENLATVAGIARAQGAQVVLMTQASTWGGQDPRAARWHWMMGKDARYREQDLAAALEEYNDAMRATGERLGVPVFDLARAVPGTLDHFYDDVHFNVRGAETAGTLLARFLVEQGVMSVAGGGADAG